MCWIFESEPLTARLVCCRRSRRRSLHRSNSSHSTVAAAALHAPQPTSTKAAGLKTGIGRVGMDCRPSEPVIWSIAHQARRRRAMTICVAVAPHVEELAMTWLVVSVVSRRGPPCRLGCAHGRLIYAPGSLKARFCREGNAATLAFSHEHRPRRARPRCFVRSGGWPRTFPFPTPRPDGADNVQEGATVS
jgi:hypothetical protein